MTDSDLVVASAFAVPVAVSTGPASAAAIAKSTTTAATRAIFTRTSKIHSERASAEILPMEHRDGALCFLGGGHFHKAKAFGAAARAISDHLSGFHCACLRKQGLQVSIDSGVRQIAYIKFRFHSNTLLLSVGCESEAAFTAMRIQC